MAPGETSLVLSTGEVDGVRVAYVTPDTFRFLAATPLAGRPFIAADAAPGAAPVVLLREGLWHRHFDRLPSVVGQTIELGGSKRVVIGVMPDRFEFPFSGDAWLPLDDRSLADAGVPIASARLIGVLKPGISAHVAEAEVQTLAPPIAAAGQAPTPLRVHLESFATNADAAVVILPIVLTIIVFTLLVVVGNVAVLMTARGAARATELAVRAALGAGRSRLVGQLTAEMIVLGATASALGVSAATAALRWIDAAYPGIPFWIELQPGASTLLFVVILALLTIALAGVWPAVIVTRGSLTETLQHGSRTASGNMFGRTAGVMIAVQIAMAVGLLSGAVSMARGLLAYVEGPAHVRAGQLLTARVQVRPMRQGGDFHTDSGWR
jgi:putative ABC transport system permease protein